MFIIEAVHRDRRYFSPDTEKFWPERWLPEGLKIAETRGETFVHDTSAYMPFSFGVLPSPSFDDIVGLK
jgi:cytochrome P450